LLSLAIPEGGSGIPPEIRENINDFMGNILSSILNILIIELCIEFEKVFWEKPLNIRLVRKYNAR